MSITTQQIIGEAREHARDQNDRARILREKAAQLLAQAETLEGEARKTSAMVRRWETALQE